MKKITSLLILLISIGIFIQSVQGQRISVAGSELKPSSASNLSRVAATANTLSVIDTLRPPILTPPLTSCADSVFYYTYNGGAGYVTGNNALGSGLYHSVELAQRYAFSGSGTVTDVLIWYAKVTGTNGQTYVKVYNVSAATKKPTTAMIDSSVVITTGILTTTPYTDYSFPTPPTITTNFAVSCVLPKPVNGDTVVVWQTQFTCHSADSLSSEHYYDSTYTTNYGWVLYTYWLNASSPDDTSLDLYILPVVNVTSTGINDPPTSKGLSLLGAYPNPASSLTTIGYRVDNTSEATISVFDLSGKVYENITEVVATGDHQFQLNVKDMAAGNYFYTIKTAEAMLTSKFTVVK